ncbi:sensor histidine kinase [Gaoshiqia sediminis]|uniref:histidine kinase n=1 Tax=Gaoshiqia sediminis TaxID=2986998 RepID=A0AA41Y5D4_9BACT|nr:HAMP domain-containing sensor histidine kinase [Gaoshiqia sediminis]MCW0483734.1 HAMP domain-containing histidine kinase [Gaoshiqia sediminis]
MKIKLLYQLLIGFLCFSLNGSGARAAKADSAVADIKANISSLNKLAAAESEKENYPTSFQLSSAALDLSLKYGLLDEAIIAYENLGNYYLTYRNITQGLNNLNEAIRLSEKLGQHEKALHLHKKTAGILKQIGDYRNSLEHLDRYQALQDSLSELDKNNQLAGLEQKYSDEQAASQAQLMEARSETQHVIRLSLLIAAGLILLVAVAWTVALKKHREVKRYFLKLNEQKDRMFSLISHGLRGPIGSVKGIFDLIVEQDLEDPQELKSILYESREVVDSSFNLLENLLNWSKSQTGQLTVNPQKISIASLVKENLQLFTSSIKHKNFVIENQVDENHFAYADMEMVNVVVRNILSNSVKFTRTAGKISLHSQVAKGKLLLTVSDTGVGMTPEMIEDIMEDDPIALGPAEANYDKDRGIGLKICKDFLERNSGGLSIESSPNNGSRFMIYLPLSA